MFPNEIDKDNPMCQTSQVFHVSETQIKGDNTSILFALPAYSTSTHLMMSSHHSHISRLSHRHGIDL
jgi:hypothetical protein